jgi:signal transduction histidine kinase/DNA-binding response OmpR family regulator
VTLPQLSDDGNKTPTVLLVDDRNENLLALEAVLGPLEIRLQKAANADAALWFLLHNDVALILLDVEMPGIDGFETASLVRQRPRSADTPIIFITAVDSDESRIREGYKLGAVDYITKPFQPDILRWKVSVFVQLYRSRQHERLLAQEHANRIHAEAAMRRSRLLADAGAALASSMDQNRILEALANRLVPDFAELGAIFKSFGDKNEGLRLTAVFPPDHPVPPLDIRFQEDPIAKAFERGKPFLIERLSAYARSMDASHTDLQRHFNMHSALFLPLCGPRACLGVLALYRGRANPFREADQALAEELCERIMLAMTNAALYRASQEANRAKDEFLATVSHELRTPLVSIIGWTKILLSRKLQPEALEAALKTIDRNASLQNKLIGDILDFSRMAEGRISLDLQSVDLREVIAHSVDSMRPIADDKGIRVLCQMSNESVAVDGDPTRLHQLVTNLLSNAVKFTPKNGTVTVTLQRTEESVRIVIKDTGIGIKPEFLPRVFDAFVQEDSSNARSYYGLGLGLAIVRHVVELHHGQIQVESGGRGQGATFTVTLPAKFRDIQAV